MRKSKAEMLRLRREEEARIADRLERLRRGSRPKPITDRVPEPYAMKVAVIGTRSFNDYELLARKLNLFLMEVFDPIILVGESGYGAGKLALKWAEWNWYRCQIFRPDKERHGVIAAFHIRNREMTKAANWCVAFWNGKSKGTKDTLALAEKFDIDPIQVVTYD